MSDKNTSAILKYVYPLVEASLSRNGGVKKYKDCVQRFFESRPFIFSNIPNNRIAFGAEQVNDFYTSLGISPEQVLEGLKKTFYWDMNYSPICAKDSLTVTALMVVRYFIEKNDSKNAQLAAIYLSFTGKMYASVHKGQFPFLADDCDTIMTYVANTQITGKFDLKKEKNIFGVVRKMSDSWMAAYKSKFKKCTDDDVGYLLKQLRNRIASFMKNFAALYYKAYENKDYLNYESDNYDDDAYRVSDNDVIRADRYAEKTMHYMNANAVDYKICTMCADQNVRKDEIKEIMESILSNSDNIPTMKELVSNIIADYMRNSETKDVRDLQFVSYSVTMKPNAKDPNLVRIKDIIYTWLEDNSAGYRRRKNRIATRNSYYKAVIEYVVLVINKANK
jgi:hypothetical protein